MLEIAPENAFAVTALAGDDEQTTRPALSLAFDEGLQMALGRGLGKAVQVEPAINIHLAAPHAPITGFLSLAAAARGWQG